MGRLKQLRDDRFRQAIHAVVEQMDGRCALAGVVGVQIHLAAAIGLDKLGPPAHAIEVVAFGGARVPDRIDDVPVVTADPLGFEASVEAATTTLDVTGEAFPVASPEHILGMLLAAPELPTDAKWACFILMRTYAGRLDLEETRGFLKRCAAPDRQSLLAELAYLAA
jgi:hypothetical protein